MLGLMLAAVYLIYLNLIGKSSELSFYYATNFLLYWYIGWALILSVAAGILAAVIGVISHQAAEEAAKGKVGAKILALAIGESFSLIAVFLFLFRRICFVFGAYFWHMAADVQKGSLELAWLVLGGIFMLIALWRTGLKE